MYERMTQLLWLPAQKLEATLYFGLSRLKCPYLYKAVLRFFLPRKLYNFTAS